MKCTLFASMLWMTLACTAQASEPEFVQVSPGVWMVTVKNHAGIFASAATTKRKALLAANAFAVAKDMQAVPVAMEAVDAGGPGQWPYVEYQFRLVPQGSKDAVGLQPRADMQIEVSASAISPATTSPATTSAAPHAHDTQPDLYAELLKLDDLRKKGLLTEAEFQAQKAKLLSR
ncbi:MAG: SHOCT domain-containing protein [Xanthomonas sp.]